MKIKAKILYLFFILIFLFTEFLFSYKLKKKKEKFYSYSDFYEDLILYDVLYDVKKGFYIDVGANDPFGGSVTSYFYNNGWNGINIEPLEDKYIRLVKYRPRDINLKICASDREGNMPFYLRGGGSTLKEKEFRKWNVTRKSVQTTVNVTTMEKICRKYINKSKIIDFLKVDVEGSEKEVLLGFNFKEYRPKVIVMESTIPFTDIPSHQEWEKLLLYNDYEFAFQHSINRYYTDKKKELKDKFIGLEKLMEKYKIKKFENI